MSARARERAVRRAVVLRAATLARLEEQVAELPCLDAESRAAVLGLADLCLDPGRAASVEWLACYDPRQRMWSAAEVIDRHPGSCPACWRPAPARTRWRHLGWYLWQVCDRRVCGHGHHEVEVVLGWPFPDGSSGASLEQAGPVESRGVSSGEW